MLPAEIDSMAESLFDGALREEEFAHDGEPVPEPVRAEVMRRAASKLINLAVYIEGKP